MLIRWLKPAEKALSHLLVPPIFQNKINQVAEVAMEKIFQEIKK
jgi:hypothetical protein